MKPEVLHRVNFSIRQIDMESIDCMFLSCHVCVTNGWVFVYELSGCGFESSCSHMESINCKCCWDVEQNPKTTKNMLLKDP